MPHLPSAYNLARWLLRSDSDAEDVVQEACLRAFEHFSEIRGANAGPWLLAIVRNSAFGVLRKSRGSAETLPLDSLDSDSLIASGDATEEKAMQSIAIGELHSAIDRLQAEFKEMIVLRDIEGFSYAEIADVTRLPIGTVMSRLNRARKALRALVADLYVDDGGVRP